MNRVQLEDCQNIGSSEFIDWELLRGSTILITGATGLIGSNLVNAIAYNNQEKGLGIKLILPVRNTSHAEELFAWADTEIVAYELGAEPKIGSPVDYIVHLASPTSSKYFIEQPVDTMVDNFSGVMALLNWAMKHPVKKFVVLSTMEVYGFPERGHKVTENEIGSFETMNARNSYPVAKLACECLCNSYYSQYGIPVVILRATQTFGPGVKYDDGRVFAQFMRCVKEGKDIILKSKGLTERPYLYTADAVSAILVSLLRATPGQAYTVANPKTYCSIKEMAYMVANEIADGKIKVVFDLSDDIEKLGYANTLFMDLDVGKIQGIGWRPSCDLKSMFERMIESQNNQEV